MNTPCNMIRYDIRLLPHLRVAVHRGFILDHLRPLRESQGRYRLVGVHARGRHIAYHDGE